MIRDSKGDLAFWNKWTKFTLDAVHENKSLKKQPSGNPTYEPQFILNECFLYTKLILRRYSRGDPVSELVQHFPDLLDAWELSNHLAEKICAKEGIAKCRDWTFEFGDLNHYIWCFWLVGLALLLEIPDEQWRRLIVLVDNEEQDVLLDRIIANRQPDRRIGQKLLHSAPYSRLLKAINAPKVQQPALLKEFIDHWYAELDRSKKRGTDPVYYRPYWYDYGDNNFEGGSYFGRWCIEAAVVAKVFNVDDSLCLGYEHYPGDLVRPNGPSTHLLRLEPKRGLFEKLFGKRKS